MVPMRQRTGTNGSARRSLTCSSAKGNSPCGAENVRLLELLNTPEIRDFAKAVTLEAGHQRERWGAAHDAGKTDADWFWLIGYLGSKALLNPGGDREKQLHRIVTVGAAAANWHAQVLAELKGTSSR